MIQLNVTLPGTAQLTLFGPPVVHSVLPMDVYTLPEGLYLHFDYEYDGLPTSVGPRESEALGLGEDDILPGVMVRPTEDGGLCAHGESIAPRVVAALAQIASRLRVLLVKDTDETEELAQALHDDAIQLVRNALPDTVDRNCIQLVAVDNPAPSCRQNCAANTQLTEHERTGESTMPTIRSPKRTRTNCHAINRANSPTSSKKKKSLTCTLSFSEAFYFHGWNPGPLARREVNCFQVFRICVKV